MDTDKLKMLFESADPGNSQLAFQLMMGLESPEAPFSHSLLESATLGLETILSEQEEKERVYATIWHWIMRFRLPIRQSSKL